MQNVGVMKLETWDISKFSRHGGPIKDGDAIGITFDLGVIDHPNYGRAEKLSGVIPLLKRQGEFPIPKILYDEPRLTKLVKDLAREWSYMFENDLDEEIEAKIRDLILFPIMGDPEWDDMEHPRMKLRILSMVTGFFADDIVDYMDEAGLAGNGMDYKDFKGSALINDFLTVSTGYEKEENCPTFCPELAKYRKSWLAFMKGLNENVENFSGERGNAFREVTSRSFQGFMLIRGSNAKSKSKRLSEAALAEMNAWTTGFIQPLEFTPLFVCNEDLPKVIREDVLFERYRIWVGACSGLMNAVFGLARDVNTDQVNDSPILRQVVYHGVPLQTAFDKIFEKLLENMNDMRCGAELLLARYGHVPALKTYIHYAELLTDGQYYTYLHIKRYGKTNLKIQKVVE